MGIGVEQLPDASADRHDAVRFVHEEQVAFDRAPREEPLEDGPVADHLELVLVGKMADAARLEVDEGDAVGGEDEPVDDAEGAGVGEVLFGENPAGPEEDLAHLGVAQELLDGGRSLVQVVRARLSGASVLRSSVSRASAAWMRRPRSIPASMAAERRVGSMSSLSAGVAGPSARSGAVSSS